MATISVQLDGYAQFVTLKVVSASDLGLSGNKNTSKTKVELDIESTESQIKSVKKVNRIVNTPQTRKVVKKNFFAINKESCKLGSLARFHRGNVSVEEYTKSIEQREQMELEKKRKVKRERIKRWKKRKETLALSRAKIVETQRERLSKHKIAKDRDKTERQKKLEETKSYSAMLRRRKDILKKKLDKQRVDFSSKTTPSIAI